MEGKGGVTRELEGRVYWRPPGDRGPRGKWAPEVDLWETELEGEGDQLEKELHLLLRLAHAPPVGWSIADGGERTNVLASVEYPSILDDTKEGKTEHEMTQEVARALLRPPRRSGGTRESAAVARAQILVVSGRAAAADGSGGRRSRQVLVTRARAPAQAI